MQKFLIATALTVSMASVCHAQSYDSDLGSGNVLSNNQATILQQEAAFAMVPHRQVRIQADSPASAGGGSLGYNEMLRMY